MTTGTASASPPRLASPDQRTAGHLRGGSAAIGSSSAPPISPREPSSPPTRISFSPPPQPAQLLPHQRSPMPFLTSPALSSTVTVLGSSSSEPSGQPSGSSHVPSGHAELSVVDAYGAAVDGPILQRRGSDQRRMSDGEWPPRIPVPHPLVSGSDPSVRTVRSASEGLGDYDWAYFMSAYAAGRWDPNQIPNPPKTIVTVPSRSVRPASTTSTPIGFPSSRDIARSSATSPPAQSAFANVTGRPAKELASTPSPSSTISVLHSSGGSGELGSSASTTISSVSSCFSKAAEEASAAPPVPPSSSPPVTRRGRATSRSTPDIDLSATALASASEHVLLPLHASDINAEPSTAATVRLASAVSTSRPHAVEQSEDSFADSAAHSSEGVRASSVPLSAASSSGVLPGDKPRSSTLPRFSTSASASSVPNDPLPSTRPFVPHRTASPIPNPPTDSAPEPHAPAVSEPFSEPSMTDYFSAVRTPQPSPTTFCNSSSPVPEAGADPRTDIAESFANFNLGEDHAAPVSERSRERAPRVMRFDSDTTVRMSPRRASSPDRERPKSPSQATVEEAVDEAWCCAGTVLGTSTASPATRRRRLARTQSSQPDVPFPASPQTVQYTDNLPASIAGDTKKFIAQQQFEELGYLVAPLPPDEEARRRALYRFGIMHTAPDVSFDRIAHLAKLVFQTRIVIITLVDGREQWYKSESGLGTNMGMRGPSFCAHSILQKSGEPMVVLDASLDWRFAKNPLVVGHPHIRFYAGAPLRTSDGHSIGSLCVIDDQPRSDFTPRQRHTLKEFAAIVMRELELWRDKIQLRVRDRIQTSMEEFTRDILEMDSGSNRPQVGLTNMQNVYERAARLVQRTLGVEGAVILDISQFELAEAVGEDGTTTHYYFPNPNVHRLQSPSTASSSRASSPTRSTSNAFGPTPAMPVLAASELNTPPDRAKPLSAADTEKLSAFLRRHPDGHIFESGVVPSCFRHFIGPKTQYAMVVPVFNMSHEREGPFALLLAYTTDRKQLLEGYELQFLRAIGVIILSAVLKQRILLADKAKQNFISNISHELRTPLHGILAAAELLKETPLDPNQTEFLDTVSACGRSLAETLNHVLDFTKLSGASSSSGIEKGMRLSKVDLRKLVEETVESSTIGHRGRVAENASEIGSVYAPPSGNSPSIGQKVDQVGRHSQVETIIDIDFCRSWVCRCEKGGLRRVLQNLIGNSQKFTKSGFVHVQLRELAHSPGSKNIPIELAVLDSGKGISKEFIDDQLFQPFSQEDPLQAGTGLGLAIVDSIVKSASVNGQIDVRSREGAGTEIRITLEVEMVEDAPPKTVARRGLAARLGFESTWRPTVSLHGFDEEHRGVKALRDVIEKYLVVWYDLDIVSGEYGDILLVNDDPSVLNTLVLQRDAHRPALLLSSSRADKSIGASVDAYARAGGIARVIYKPAGPSRLEGTLESFLRILDVRKGGKGGLFASESSGESPFPSPANSSISGRTEYFTAADIGVQTPEVHTPDVRTPTQEDRTPTSSVPQRRPPEASPLVSPAVARASFDADNATSTPIADGTSGTPSGLVRRRSEDQRSSSAPRRPTLPPRSITYQHSFSGEAAPWASFSSNASNPSTPGTPGTPGSTISIAGSSGAMLKSATETEPVKAPGQPFRVLCVDDNDINLKLLTTFLKKKGCQYVEACNGAEAVHAVETRAPGYFAVILMDVSMPVMDGLTATTEIRKIESSRRRAESTGSRPNIKPLVTAPSNSWPSTKIFALTGLASREDRRRAFAAGVDGYLIKPVSFRSLSVLFSNIGFNTDAP